MTRAAGQGYCTVRAALGSWPGGLHRNLLWGADGSALRGYALLSSSIVCCIHAVKRTAYMEFREALDKLGERVTHEEVAEALGVSVASVRQYRLSEEARAHRSPPPGWPGVLEKLARMRGEELIKLAEALNRAKTSRL